jgi:hypothetical protein
MQLFYVVTSLMYGAVRATTIRIGHHLGANEVKEAKLVAKIDMAVSGAIGKSILPARSGCKYYITCRPNWSNDTIILTELPWAHLQ